MEPKTTDIYSAPIFTYFLYGDRARSMQKTALKKRLHFSMWETKSSIFLIKKLKAVFLTVWNKTVMLNALWFLVLSIHNLQGKTNYLWKEGNSGINWRVSVRKRSFCFSFLSFVALLVLSRLSHVGGLLLLGKLKNLSLYFTLKQKRDNRDSWISRNLYSAAHYWISISPLEAGWQSTSTYKNYIIISNNG